MTCDIRDLFCIPKEIVLVVMTVVFVFVLIGYFMKKRRDWYRAQERIAELEAELRPRIPNAGHRKR